VRSKLQSAAFGEKFILHISHSERIHYRIRLMPTAAFGQCVAGAADVPVRGLYGSHEKAAKYNQLITSYLCSNAQAKLPTCISIQQVASTGTGIWNAEWG